MTTDTLSTPISGAEARRAARNAGAIAAARILSSGALFGWQLVLGGWLGVQDYGIYGTVGALFAVAVPIASFSMGMIVIRDVARDPKQAGRYLTATLFVQTLLALVGYIGINGAAALLHYPPEIRTFAAFAGVSLFVDLLGNLCYDQLIAREEMVTTSAVDIVHILVRIGLSGLALVSGFGLLGVYAATIFTGTLRSAVLGYKLWRGGVRPQWPVDWTIGRVLLVNSAPLALSGFLSLAYQHTDKLMTTSLIGETGTGYLTAAFVIIYGVVELLSTTILIATYPMMSRTYADEARRNVFGFMVQKLAFFTLVIALPLSLTLSTFAADITVPLFGDMFRPSADVLSVLIWYALLTMIANVFAQGFMVQNRQRHLLIIRASGLAINIALNLLLITRLGVRGAALASVCAEAIVLALMLANFRAEGWDWRPLMPRALRLAALGLVVALAMRLLGGVHPVFGIVGGLALYAGGVLAARVLAADDWDLLYRLAAAMPGGALLLKVWRRNVELGW
jgi:O-antigen/teichoic acid export membrane protein